MTTINVYLTFDGNCEEAFNYYKTVFGGGFQFVSRFSDMPTSDQGGMDIATEDRNRIMHISLQISTETVLMGSDRISAATEKFIQGNNFSIFLRTDSRAKADQFFKQLSEGGVVKMPMSDTFWENYFGICQDKFGVNWMIATTEQSVNA